MKPIDELSREMKTGATDALANLDSAVRLYIFENQRSAYRTVLTNLRVLLLDKHAVRSFGGRWKKTNLCLLEAVYGHGDCIFLQSLKIMDMIGYIPGLLYGPSLYSDPAALIKRARRADHLMPLNAWLDEGYVEDQGNIKEVRTLLDDLADKEGAHVIGVGKGTKDWRKRIPGGVIIRDTDEEYSEHGERGERDRGFGMAWEQFAIDAAIKLLFACAWKHGLLVRLFDYPTTTISDEYIDEFINRNAMSSAIVRQPGLNSWLQGS